MPIALVRSLPKVALHDHLDGGLRPGTIVDLAAERRLPLPEAEADLLSDWFYRSADSGSLPRYLETFEVTVSVMQTKDALTRVAREFVEDMAADGVVYAETRWAPEQHLRGGLTLDEAVAAVQRGLDDGMAGTANRGTPVHVRQILASMRQAEPTLTIARLVADWLGRGVVGFDLAGPEAGFPASRYREAIAHVRSAGGRVTIHGGEAAGLESIRDALDCGAERLGHGVRLIDDIAGSELGPLARQVRDRDITLEVCPTSNLQTGVAASIAQHPFAQLMASGLPVTVSCDNRLMSRTSLTRELVELDHTFRLGARGLGTLTRRAMRAAFCEPELVDELLETVMEPAYPQD
ncbi:adenosine deaminase [Tessaracoccus lapidicaptus]|uniref:adenosine deaminase n=1 Tax=Tessaracoccus lapidicaptus TaxID=1427523 RepID=UPI00333F883C